MTNAETGTLQVSGGTLFYKQLGTGPILLILQGGDGDAEASNGMAG